MCLANFYVITDTNNLPHKVTRSISGVWDCVRQMVWQIFTMKKDYPNIITYPKFVAAY